MLRGQFSVRVEKLQLLVVLEGNVCDLRVVQVQRSFPIYILESATPTLFRQTAVSPLSSLYNVHTLHP